jgi:5-methylcytosine-specific restriction endonuclease McrA
VEPTAWSSWRLAVLMGANTRTYKFALGAALLDYARAGRADVLLSELAAPSAMSLVEHLAKAPQGPGGRSWGNSDFLTVARQEAEESKARGQPTEPLLDAAMRSMPGMVMQKFHHLGGGTEVAHRFYDLTGSRRERVVRFTPALHQIAQSEQADNLRSELQARWSIIESSFEVSVGRSLITEGVAVDWQTLRITDKLRRRSVTGVTDAVIGFQHGRCLICGDTLAVTDAVDIDHIFPFSLMHRTAPGRSWQGPDLDAIWNLAPTHASCNAAKSNRLPTPAERQALAHRNTAIMQSPHPLRRTLQLTLTAAGRHGSRHTDWSAFIGHVLEGL